MYIIAQSRRKLIKSATIRCRNFVFRSSARASLRLLPLPMQMPKKSARRERRKKYKKEKEKWTGRDIATKAHGLRYLVCAVCNSFWPFHSRSSRPAMRKIRLCSLETSTDTDPKISHVTLTRDRLAICREFLYSLQQRLIISCRERVYRLALIEANRG